MTSEPFDLSKWMPTRATRVESRFPGMNRPMALSCGKWTYSVVSRGIFLVGVRHDPAEKCPFPPPESGKPIPDGLPDMIFAKREHAWQMQLETTWHALQTFALPVHDWTDCPACDGSGEQRDLIGGNCADCAGSGFIGGYRDLKMGTICCVDVNRGVLAWLLEPFPNGKVTCWNSGPERGDGPLYLDGDGWRVVLMGLAPSARSTAASRKTFSA